MKVACWGLQRGKVLFNMGNHVLDAQSTWDRIDTVKMGTSISANFSNGEVGACMAETTHASK